MTVEHHTLCGHPATIIRVKKWRSIYRYFNLLFARATLPHEFIICEEGYRIS